MRYDAASGGTGRLGGACVSAVAAAILFGCAVPARPVAAPLPDAPSAVCPLGGCASDFPTVAGEVEQGACAGLEQCRDAEPASCTQRAMSVWSTLRDERDLACVRRMLENACELGEMPACGFAGRMALGAIGEARDSKRGIEMLVSACYAGIDLDCAVAKQWLDALHHATDIPHGEDLAARMELQRVCLSGSAQQCYDLGILLDRGGPGLAPDGSHAVQALARGCNLGLAESCDGLADVLWYGRGVAQDRPRATAVYERACKLGLPNGCANVAFAMEFGAHSVKERTRALLLYGEACRAGSVYACFHVAMRDAQDRAGLRDPQAALARWSAACEGGDAQACAFAGVMWEDGPDGQARDEEKSQSAMTRACDLHNDRACQWLGTAQEE